MELLDICLTTMHFQSEDEFYQQKEGMAMGNSLSLVVSNIFKEHSEEIALDTADHKPTKWLRYVDYPSVRLQQFLYHLDTLRPAIKFKMEVEVLNWL
jgi:hypothetical protein